MVKSSRMSRIAQTFILQLVAVAPCLGQWDCSISNANGHLWMRSYYQDARQFDWRLGAGGALAELRDATNGRQLLASSFQGEATDRIIQWTLWSNGILAANSPYDKRLNVTQGGTYTGMLSPIVSASYDAAGTVCTASITSHQKDLWFNVGAQLGASLPAITTYIFRGGLLTIDRYVLVHDLRRNGKTVPAAPVYFEAWTPFSETEFDSLALGLDGQGKPTWWYSMGTPANGNSGNLPLYPRFRFDQTKGYASVFKNSSTVTGPVINIIFGRHAPDATSGRRLNVMGFRGGFAVLPSVERRSVPIGSLIHQQIKIYMTRGLSPHLGAALQRESQTIIPATIYFPTEPLTPQLQSIRQLLEAVPDKPFVRTERLAIVGQN